MKNVFLEIPEAIKQIKKGKMLILIDNPKRENEGDFFFPAAMVNPEKVNTLLHSGRGLVCVAISKDIAHKLHLPLMVSPVDNTEKTGVNFTVSVNAKKGIGSGVSAFDRSKTIKILGNKNSKSSDLTQPGHVFPLIAHDSGLLKRQGHTEAAVTLSALAGFTPAGVLCEILKEDGKVATLKNLISLSQKLGIGIISIDDLAQYIKENPVVNYQKSIIKTASSTLPTNFGVFQASVYQSIIDNREHLVLKLGKKLKEPTLIRLHSQCLTGDTLFSLKCDCGEQLYQSLKKISQQGEGLLLYLNQEGRGIGLTNKIKAYALQEKGMDTVEANKALKLPVDARDFKVAAEILNDLGIKAIKLLTNNPQKQKTLENFGILVKEQIPLEIKPNRINKNYLLTKKMKLGHKLSLH